MFLVFLCLAFVVIFFLFDWPNHLPELVLFRYSSLFTSTRLRNLTIMQVLPSKTNRNIYIYTQTFDLGKLWEMTCVR